MGWASLVFVSRCARRPSAASTAEMQANTGISTAYRGLHEGSHSPMLRGAARTSRNRSIRTREVPCRSVGVTVGRVMPLGDRFDPPRSQETAPCAFEVLPS